MIAGGGYIGVEMAEAALRQGYAVTLLTRSRVMHSLDTDMRVHGWSRGLNESAGVEVVVNAEVAGFALEDGEVAGCTAREGAPVRPGRARVGVPPSTGFLDGSDIPLGA